MNSSTEESVGLDPKNICLTLTSSSNMSNAISLHEDRISANSDERKSILRSNKRESSLLLDNNRNEIKRSVSIEEHQNGTEHFRMSLATVQRIKSKQFANDLKATNTAFMESNDISSSLFCGETFSWYNMWVWRVNACGTAFVIFSLFTIPYLCFFSSVRFLYDYTVSVDVLYTFILFLRSRTSYIVDGFEERNLLKVRYNYQASWIFALDIISYLPQLYALGTFFYLGDEQYGLETLIKCTRFHFVIYFFAQREAEPGSSTLAYRTVKYIFLSLLLVNCTACGWYSLACSSYTEEQGFSISLCNSDSWIMFLPEAIMEKMSSTNTHHHIPNSEVSFLHNTFVTSLYWATSTATSTGYGDVHAYTISEKLYSIIAMLLGTLVLYGITMGGMTSMLTNIDAKRSTFIHRFKAFKEEVERMGITDNIKDMSLRYYDYLWHRWEGENIYLTGVLDSLPQPLQSKFAEESFRSRMIDKVELFSGMDESFHRNLAMAVHPAVYLENQVLRRSGSIDNNMMFIQNGTIEVLDEADNDRVVIRMHAGKLFGQIMLVYDLPRTNSMRCKTNCDIFKINKYDFRKVLADYPEAAEKFIHAVTEKCRRPSGSWPLEPPSYDTFKQFLVKNSAVKRRNTTHLEKLPQKTTDATAPPNISMARRLTKATLNNYEDVDVPTIEENTGENIVSIAKETDHRNSMVHYLMQGNRKYLGKRLSATLEDGTEMLAEYNSLKDLKEAAGSTATLKDPEITTRRGRFDKVTLINPKGKFYKFWINYIAVLSVMNGLYATFMAAFATTPGQQKTYIGAEAETLDLFDIAYYTSDCNSSLVASYTTACGLLTNFREIAQCISNVGGPLGERIEGSPAEGFNITVPGSYDISSALNNPNTVGGMMHTYLPIIFFDLSLYLNIFVTLRTEVLTLHGTRSNFKDIFANYNKWHWLWLDVAAVVPIELIIAPFVGCSRILYYHGISFGRLNRCLYFFRYVPAAFARWEDNLDSNISRIRILKFIVYIYTTTHMCACAFYWRSCAYVMHTATDTFCTKCQFGSWGWVYGLTYDTSRLGDYITSMYWASTTLTSVGFGDITPSTTTGRVFALSTMVIGAIIYGWLIAVIASTLSNNVAAEANYRSSMVAVQYYLQQQSVPMALINRIMNVRRIEWERYKGTAIPGVQNIGRELPEQLQCVMLYESVRHFVENLPFFYGVDSSFIVKLCTYVKVYHYSEGDVIVYQGDLQRALYIIKQGHCDAVTEDLTEVTGHLVPGDYFGEVSLLFDCASERTIISDTACEIICLKKSDVDAVLESFPVLQAQMLEVEENMVYKESVLEAIEKRNIPRGIGDDMTRRYEIAELEGGSKYYGKRLNKPRALCRLPKEDQAMKATQSIFVKILSSLLLPWAIWPLSRAFRVYETIRIILIFVNMVLFPLQFGLFPQATYLMYMQYVLDGISVLDQYVRAHVAYYNDRGIPVTHPTYTALHYLKTSFVSDMMAWFPIELLVAIWMKPPFNKRQWRLIAILRLNRLIQMNKVLGYFSFWLSDIRKSRRWLKHFSSFFYAALMHNFFACVLYLAACPPEAVNKDSLYKNMSDMIYFSGAGDEYCHETTWMGKIATGNAFLHLDRQQSASDQYIISLYWSTVTLVCAGYGDVHAYTLVEMVMSTVLMVLGTIYYSSILGELSANIQTEDTRRGQYKGKLRDIKKFFRIHGVSEETRLQVLEYYYYLWDRTHGVTPDYLMVGLPSCLRSSVYQCMYDRSIKEAFAEGEPDKETQGFFRLVASRIHPYFFLKGNIICRQGDKAEEMFFIKRGEIAVMRSNNKSILKTLGAGQHFGEVALVFGTTRSYTVKALNHCDVNILTKKDLDRILDKFPQFREKLARVAEERSVRASLAPALPGQFVSESPINKQFSFQSSWSTVDLTKINIFTVFDKVFDRDSRFAEIWKHVTVALSLISSSLIVYRVCFFNHNLLIYMACSTIDCWFLADMLLSFHMNYLNKFSATINDLSKINSNYFKKPEKFLLDVITNVPLELLGYAIGSDLTTRLLFMSYAQLNRMLRVYKLLREFAEWESDIRRQAIVLRLYKSLLLVVFTINTLGCIWYSIAFPNGIGRPHSWGSIPFTNYKKKKIYGHNLIPWVDSMYWLSATLTSTGYGDIKPESQLEMVYACTIMVIGKIIVGYILGMAAATMANDEGVQVWYEQSVASIKRYMEDLKFKKELYDHIVEYYDFMWMKNNGVSVEDLFPDLTFSLRADVYSQICKRNIDNIELFDSCPENFIRHLCTEIVPMSFMPGDYICLQGDYRNELYMINHGVAEAVKHGDEEKTFLRLVLEGESFMDESVLCKVQHPCSLRARTYVDVFTLSKESLDKVLQGYPGAQIIIRNNGRRLFPNLKF